MPSSDSPVSRNALVRLVGLVVILTFFGAIAPPAQAQSGTRSLDEFWSLEEFSARSPRQQNHADSFARRVNASASPLAGYRGTARIAVIYPGKQVSDYWRRSLLSFEARLNELAVPYEIGSFFSGSPSFVGNQADLIAAALKEDPDYLVFTLDVLRHKALVQRLIARGRPKVILQNITTPVRAWRERQPFLYVGFDHVTGTNLLIDYYKKRFGAKKDFAILYGPQGYVSRARGNTFLQAYSDADTPNLKASYFVGYDRQRSREAATQILQNHPDLTFIYSCSTDIALGVLDAIAALDSAAATNGWGGGSAELEAISAGQLEVTVMRMNDDNGVAMAEAVALDLAGRGDEVPVVYSGAFELVTRTDSNEHLDELKARAFRYSK